MDNPLLALQVQPANIDIGGSIARGQEVQTAKLSNILQQYKLQQAQRLDAQNNALAQLYRENGAGLAAGDEGAINTLAAVDPAGAQGFRKEALAQKETQQKLDLGKMNLDDTKVKQGLERMDFVARSADSILAAPAEARPLLWQRTLQQANDMGMDMSSAPQEYSDQMLAGMRDRALSVKDQITEHQNSPEYKGQVAAAEAKAKFPYEQKLAQTKAANADDVGWQVMQDPSNGKQFRYNARTGQATDLSGGAYTPGGAGKLASTSARSPAAMFLQKYQQEHPQAGSAELADVAASFGAQQKAVKDFATGPEGNIITRINTAVSHLDTLQKVGEALDNGDVQAFNKLRNLWRTQFGSELPTNFNAAMPIVAGEVSKAVVGTQGGTREDRAELEASLQDAASKKQLAGATGTQKALLQGQLQSRRRQYETSTGRKDFDKFLSGDTQRELGITTDAKASTDRGGPPQIKSDAEYDKLPSGTVFIDPDGKQRKKP